MALLPIKSHMEGKVMDVVGFLRVMQPSIMPCIGIIGSLVLLYLIARIVIYNVDVPEDQKKGVMVWVNRTVGVVMLLVFLVLLFNAINIAFTDRMPRSDANKTKSGVYRQMENLNKRAQ